MHMQRERDNEGERESNFDICFPTFVFPERMICINSERVRAHACEFVELLNSFNEEGQQRQQLWTSKTLLQQCINKNLSTRSLTFNKCRASHFNSFSLTTI